MSDALPTIEQIARVCHEANRAWCVIHGDTSQSEWDVAEPWQRQSAIEGVAVALGGATPEQQHAAWCEAKTLAGWVHGDVKNSTVRTHPCLVAYADLPAEQREKDHLFVAIVSALGRNGTA